jgi:hypothetical protein
MRDHLESKNHFFNNSDFKWNMKEQPILKFYTFVFQRINNDSKL